MSPEKCVPDNEHAAESRLPTIRLDRPKPQFCDLCKDARAQGFEVGYDVIPEEMDVEFDNREPAPTPPAQPKAKQP